MLLSTNLYFMFIGICIAVRTIASKWSSCTGKLNCISVNRCHKTVRRWTGPNLQTCSFVGVGITGVRHLPSCTSQCLVICEHRVTSITEKGSEISNMHTGILLCLYSFFFFLFILFMFLLIKYLLLTWKNFSDKVPKLWTLHLLPENWCLLMFQQHFRLLVLKKLKIYVLIFCMWLYLRRLLMILPCL